MNEFHGFTSDAQNLEFRIVPECVVVDVGEQSLGREGQIEVVSVHFELVGGRLLVNCDVVVCSCITLLTDERLYGYAVDVHIGCTIVTGIVSIGTVTAEGEDVTIDAEGFLVSGYRMPPLKSL